MEKGRIDLLVGASVYAQIIQGLVIKGKASEPVASLFSLGWLICDECYSLKPNSAEIVTSHCVQLLPLEEMIEPIDSSMMLGDCYTAASRSLQRMETRFKKDEKLKGTI